jgi:hypothetical protein
MGGKSTSQNQNQFQIQNQTTQSAPWSIAQPGLQQSLDLAQRAANTTYNGSSVAALDPLVTQGQNLNIGAAAANQPGQMATNFVNAYQPLLANGGVSALGLSGVGKNDAATMARVGGQFSASGRYGSPANAGTAAAAIQAADNQARATQYNTDADRQLQAIQGLGNIGQAKAGIGQQGVGNINSYISALPTIAQGSVFAGDLLQKIGQGNMNYYQTVLNAQNQDPWTKAQNLAQITGGIGQLGGTSSSQGTSYSQGLSTKKEDPGVFGDIVAGVGAAANLGKAFTFV